MKDPGNEVGIAEYFKPDKTHAAIFLNSLKNVGVDLLRCRIFLVFFISVWRK